MNIKKIAEQTLTEKFNFGGEATEHLTEELETIIAIAVDCAMANAESERKRLLDGMSKPSKIRAKSKQNIHIKPRHIPDISDILKVHIYD